MLLPLALLAFPALANKSAPPTANTPSLGIVLECSIPAAEALEVLRDHGIEADQKRVTLATPIAAYDIPVIGVTAWKLGNMLGVTYTINAAALPEFIKAAGLKEWDDEDGAGLGRSFLAERNGLTAPHVADATGDVVEIDCGMRERAP
ncbi:MAG: hypothetical protein ACREO8_11515 [Luteimonas sp.]